jgi:hypothetical protein
VQQLRSGYVGTCLPRRARSPSYFRRQSESVRDASGNSACDPSIRRRRETAPALALECHQR